MRDLSTCLSFLDRQLSFSLVGLESFVGKESPKFTKIITPESLLRWNKSSSTPPPAPFTANAVAPTKSKDNTVQGE